MQVLQIEKLLDAGYYVTVDYPTVYTHEVKEKFKDMWNNEKFIPVCSIIFENSKRTIKVYMKLDDVDGHKQQVSMDNEYEDFKQAPGFTTWDEYKQDEPNRGENNMVHTHRGFKRS